MLSVGKHRATPYRPTPALTQSDVATAPMDSMRRDDGDRRHDKAPANAKHTGESRAVPVSASTALSTGGEMKLALGV